MANVYSQHGLGIKNVNLDYLRSIAEATDGGRRCVLAFGDWNLSPVELEASGILDGLGLEAVRPTISPYYVYGRCGLDHRQGLPWCHQDL